MKNQRLLAWILILCIVAAVLPCRSFAADIPGLDGVVGRFGSLSGDGLDALNDWLDGQAGSLAPELRETLRDLDADALFSDLRELVGKTADMDDEQLSAAVRAVAEQHGIHLVDSQVEQLMKLCRTMEKLDPGQLRERLDALTRELDRPGGLLGAWNSVVKAITEAADWLRRTVGRWFR